jgi:hypothetical protein
MAMKSTFGFLWQLAVCENADSRGTASAAAPKPTALKKFRRVVAVPFILSDLPNLTVIEKALFTFRAHMIPNARLNLNTPDSHLQTGISQLTLLIERSDDEDSFIARAQ